MPFTWKREEHRRELETWPHGVVCNVFLNRVTIRNNSMRNNSMRRNFHQKLLLPSPPSSGEEGGQTTKRDASCVTELFQLVRRFRRLFIRPGRGRGGRKWERTMRLRTDATKLWIEMPGRMCVIRGRLETGKVWVIGTPFSWQFGYNRFVQPISGCVSPPFDLPPNKTVPPPIRSSESLRGVRVALPSHAFRDDRFILRVCMSVCLLANYDWSGERRLCSNLCFRRGGVWEAALSFRSRELA